MVALALVALALIASALTIAGCTSKSDEAARPAPDPNTFPANYRTQIVTFLRQSLTARADFRGSQIGAPALKPIADSQRYMVCVQFNPRSQIKSKVAIFLGGQMTQFIDSTPAFCGDAVYQPFKELDAAVPAS